MSLKEFANCSQTLFLWKCNEKLAMMEKCLKEKFVKDTKFTF